ncbi:MAG: hypothetical protein V1867_00615 [Candidatus Falkowbacteria bacterium]
MKKTINAILILAAVILAVIPALAAEENPQQVVRDDNGDIVTYEQRWVETDRRANTAGIPDTVEAAKARDLLRGKIDGISTKKHVKTSFSFSLPVKVRTTDKETTGYIADGKWQEKTDDSKTAEGQNWLLTFVVIIVPALGVLILSLANRYESKGDKKLFILCAFILAVLIVPAAVNTMDLSLNPAAIVTLLTFFLLCFGVAGLIVGGYAAGDVGGPIGIFIGVMVFSGSIIFVIDQGYEDFIYYLIFMATTMLASWLIARHCYKKFPPKNQEALKA